MRRSGSGSEAVRDFLDSFDPAVGSEIRKTRPCVVISPDETNAKIRTVIVAPMTTKGRPYPTRVECTFRGKRGRIVLDQIRTVDRARLVKRMGKLSDSQASEVLSVLGAMFAE
jgi:mRNA interferase MazF